MTEAKAATTAAALINLGYQVSTSEDANGVWSVHATGAAISPQAVATFATQNGVTATVSQADFT